MNPVLDASTRLSWATRLEIDDKAKGTLLTALVHGNTDTAVELLESGRFSKKDIRSGDLKLPAGLTALHLAALYGDVGVVKALLERNADTGVTVYSEIASHSVASKYWMDARPLMFAVGAKNSEIVALLSQAGAKVEMADAWPLYSGEWWRLTGRFDWGEAKKILRTLLQHNLDVNQRIAKQRWSLLHYCVNMQPQDWSDAGGFLQQRYETVDFLLQNGADALLKDSFGRTACALVSERLDRLILDGHQEAARRRIAADRRLQELLQRAMASRLDLLRAKTGLRGSLQRFVVNSQALDRIPLLRSRASSIRRSSMSSFGGQSQVTDITLQG